MAAEKRLGKAAVSVRANYNSAMEAMRQVCHRSDTWMAKFRPALLSLHGMQQGGSHHPSKLRHRSPDPAPHMSQRRRLVNPI